MEPFVSMTSNKTIAANSLELKAKLGPNFKQGPKSDLVQQPNYAGGNNKAAENANIGGNSGKMAGGKLGAAAGSTAGEASSGKKSGDAGASGIEKSTDSGDKGAAADSKGKSSGGKGSATAGENNKGKQK
ncbi:hypothetical protein [Maritalea mediterranea]|uniref:Uncharacterized protein n=1 Tax=Maritalea mediterranea TaxID=2909667 RepID=A0ABS9E9H8_9HYPH|nr:hypothetical protein [Maritalea mediterranea]MCF4098859.1 hypothetical protein [Maritalea mediterranea]